MRKKYISLIMCVMIFLQALGTGIPAAAAVQAPDFEITRKFDKTSYNEGESAKITYTVIPKGELSGQSRKPADIVLVLDISGSINNTKMEKMRDASVNLINRIIDVNPSNRQKKDKIAVVTFGYKTNYKSTQLTTDYSSIKNYVTTTLNSYINNNSLLDNIRKGTNFDDALNSAESLLSGSSNDKYVIFVTDGKPNYFTLESKIERGRNAYTYIQEDNKYYYTKKNNGNVPEAYDQAFEDAEALMSKNVKLHTIAVGNSKGVDNVFLRKLSNTTGGMNYQCANLDSLLSVFGTISDEILSNKFSSIVISDTYNDGINIVSDNAVKEGNVAKISIPDLTYGMNQGTPGQYTFTVDIVFSKSGTYPFNGTIEYIDMSGVKHSDKTIANQTITIEAIQKAPDIDVVKEASKTNLLNGETIDLTYKVIPSGRIAQIDEDRQPIDIVLVFDRSGSMTYDPPYRWSDYNPGKFLEFKNAAKEFVDQLHAAGKADRIALISFSDEGRIDLNLTDVSTSTGKNQIKNKIDGLIADGGTNYVDGLAKAETTLQSSNRTKYVVFISDGKPTYYLGTNYRWNWKSWNWEAYEDWIYDETVGGPAYTASENKAKDLGSSGINIYTIGIGNEDYIDSAFLQKIAQLGGGEYFVADDEDGLDSIFDEVTNIITSKKISNIVIRETLPDGITLSSDNNQNNVSQEGNQLIIRCSDIVYESNKGTPAPVYYTVDLTFNAGDGTHIISPEGTVSAVAFKDYSGNAASKPINKLSFNVTTPDTKEPTVVNVFSDANESIIYKAGDIIPIYVQFNENVNVEGYPQLKLETGNNDGYAYYVSGNGTNTLLFNYTVQEGDYTVDLNYFDQNALNLNANTASIKDASDNNAILTLPAPGQAHSLGANNNIVIDAVAVASPNVSISVSDTTGVRDTYQTADNDKNIRVNKILNPAILLQGEAYAKMSIRGENVDSFEYQFISGSTVPQVMPTEDWKNISLDSQTINDDVQIDKAGYLNSRSYDVSHMPLLSGPTQWSDPALVYKTPFEATSLKAADYSATPNQYGGWEDYIKADGSIGKRWASNTVFMRWMDIEKTYGDYKEASKFWGYITVPSNGTYKFGIQSDDGCKGYITVNGVTKTFANSFKPQGTTWVSSEEAIELQAGKYYPIYLEYFNWGGKAEFVMKYSSGSNVKADVPSNWFYPSKSISPGEYTNTVFSGTEGVKLPSESGDYYVAYRAKTGQTITREGFYGPFTVEGKTPLLLSKAVPGSNTLEAGLAFDLNYTIQAPDIIPRSTFKDENGNYKQKIYIDGIKLQDEFPAGIEILGMDGNNSIAINGQSFIASIPHIEYNLITKNSTLVYVAQPLTISVDLRATAIGSYTLSAESKSILSYTDVDGKTMGQMEFEPIEIVVRDTIAPQAPTLDLASASDTGKSNTDNLTNDTTPTITGTAEAGSTVTLYNGTTVIGTTVADANGNWSITLTTALAEGSHTFTAKATDASGNTSSSSTALVVTIDITGPVVPTLDLAASSDTGVSDTDNITSDTTPTITGTAEAGSTVTLYNGTAVIGTTTADTYGNWSITLNTPLNDGNYTLTAKATDAAGNASTLSDDLILTIKTAQPVVLDVTSSQPDGTYGIDTVIPISIQFNGSVYVTGAPQLLLETGSTDRYAIYISGSGTDTLIFNYTVDDGDTTSDLNYFSTSALELYNGTIKDLAGNDGVLTLPALDNEHALAQNKNIVINTVDLLIGAMSITFENGSTSKNIIPKALCEAAILINATGSGVMEIQLRSRAQGSNEQQNEVLAQKFFDTTTFNSTARDNFGNTFAITKTADGSRKIIIRSTGEVANQTQPFRIPLVFRAGSIEPGTYKLDLITESGIQTLDINVVQPPKVM